MTTKIEPDVEPTDAPLETPPRVSSPARQGWSSVLLWVSEATTVFLNGFIAGFGVGAVVGGAAVANTDSTNTHTLTVNAALGFVLVALANGAKRIIVWHDTHPLPNPFAALPENEI